MVKFKISEFLIFFVKSLYFINTTASEETEQADFFLNGLQQSNILLWDPQIASSQIPKKKKNTMTYLIINGFAHLNTFSLSLPRTNWNMKRKIFFSWQSEAH